MIRRLIKTAITQHDEQHPPVGRLGHAITVLLAGAAITWGIAKLTKVADDLRGELQDLADERRRALDELAELRDDVSEEELARVELRRVEEPGEPAGGWVAGERPDEDEDPVDDQAECRFRSPWQTTCARDAGHRGAHRDAGDRVWRRLADVRGCEELSPGERWTCRGPAGHDGPHAAGEYVWTDQATWVHNPDDIGELDPAADAVAGALSAP